MPLKEDRVLRHIRRLLVVMLIAVSGATTALAAPPESTSPIRIIVNNWTSQIVLSRIIGEVYARMGYSVDYAELDTHVQWGRIHRGFEHIQVEVWEGTMTKEFDRAAKFGQFERPLS